MNAPNKTGKPDDSWRQIWFQNAHSDMRWAKEQGWKVSQWTVVLIAGWLPQGANSPRSLSRFGLWRSAGR